MPNEQDLNKGGQPTSTGFSNVENFGAPSSVFTPVPAPGQPPQVAGDLVTEFSGGDYTWPQF